MDRLSPDRPLRDDEDAFGHLLLDHLHGRAGRARLERDDGAAGPAMAAAYFFMPYDQWAQEERMVFDEVRGHVLDVGCGAGRHSLEAQSRGLDVTAVDISPGAVSVCEQRGVRDVRLLPLAAVGRSLGPADTVLMMCGNFGLAGSAPKTRETLHMLHELTAAGARIVLDGDDPYAGMDADDEAYHERNRALGHLPGQVTIRLVYGERATPWYDLLMVSPGELEALAADTGWRLASLVEAEPPEFFAVLEKA